MSETGESLEIAEIVRQRYIPDGKVGTNGQVSAAIVAMSMDERQALTDDVAGRCEPLDERTDGELGRLSTLRDTLQRANINSTVLKRILGDTEPEARKPRPALDPGRR